MASSDSEAITIKVQICILREKMFHMEGDNPFIAELLVQLWPSPCHATSLESRRRCVTERGPDLEYTTFCNLNPIKKYSSSLGRDLVLSLNRQGFVRRFTKQQSLFPTLTNQSVFPAAKSFKRPIYLQRTKAS